MRLINPGVWICLLIVASHAFAESPEEAVRAGRRGQTGMTDIAGDGLNVLPVKIQKKDDATTISGTLRHTYKQPLEPTLVDYSITLKRDGLLEGNIIIHPARNGDHIDVQIEGRLAGRAGAIVSPILQGVSWKEGIKKLLNILTTQVAEEDK